MTGSILNVETCEKGFEVYVQFGLLVLGNFPTGERDGAEFFRFPFAEADAFKDRILSQDDVSDVVGDILEVQTKSKEFGRVLKIPKPTVDAIHQQYSDPKLRLLHVLDEFVKQVEPPPTLRVIMETLRHPLIGQHRLAQEIESKYCQCSPNDDGSYTYSLHQSVHELCVTSLAEPRPVQKSGHTVATTSPVSVESSNTIPPGIAYYGSLMTNERVFIKLETKSKDTA